MTNKLKQIAFNIAIFVYILNVYALPVSAYNNVFSGVPQYRKTAFSDIEAKGEDYWAREAIYKMSAFGIVQGFEEGRFRPDEGVSRAQALAFIFRASSLENEAEELSEIIRKSSRDNDEMKNTGEWSDGYIGLALSEGLITKEQYRDAFSINPTSFEKNGDATRQEIAFWIAKAFGIPPISDNTLTAAFSDSYLIDFHIRPYFNALVSERIFAGSGGMLNPKGAVTRAEMAQVLSNCEAYITKKLGLTVYDGVVTAVPANNVVEIGENIIVLDEYRNEGITVFSKGRIGNFSLLGQNDLITYYVNGKDEVIFVKVLERKNSTEEDNYITSGIVYRVSGNSIMLYDESGRKDKSLLRNFQVSSKAAILLNGKSASINDIEPDDTVFLRITSGYVTEVSFAKQEQKETPEEAVSYVDNIYKAEISSYNGLNQTILVKNVFALDIANWDYTRQKGVLELAVSDTAKLYYGNTPLSFSELNEYVGSEVVFAVGRGTEKDGEVLFIRVCEDDGTTLHNGEVSSINTATQTITLSKLSRSITCGDGTMIVKGGRFVPISEISKSDVASVSVVSNNLRYNAFFVVVDDDYKAGDINIYYCKIERMLDGRIVIAASREYAYKERIIYYMQRTMSFKISHNTIFYDENGIINNRDLNLLSNENPRMYANIVVKDGEAIVVSIDRRASEVITAKVGSVKKQGNKVVELSLYRVWSYDDGSYFETLDNCPLKINDNTIILKNGKAVSPSEISAGDSITVFYSEEFIDDYSDDMMKRAMVIEIS
jgi:hypothetical protein